MKKNSFQLIDTYLGKHQERYFSNGFRHFDFKLDDISSLACKLAGTIAIRYNGPERPRGEPIHLGSLEYTAISLHIIEYALQNLIGLGLTEISRSRPMKLSYKNAKEILLYSKTLSLPFSCTLVENSLDLKAKNLGVSRFKIQLQSAKVEITVDHPCSSFIQIPRDEQLAHRKTIYQGFYRESIAQIVEINVQERKENIQAKIHPPDFIKHAFGISSSKAQILATDFIALTGQLMQVLLYQILKTKRSDCPSIFLRSMTINFGKVKQAKHDKILISFKKRKNLLLNQNDWHIIELQAKLAHFQAAFNICHLHPKTLNNEKNRN